MAWWWWFALICVEAAWVLGAWLVLGDTGAPATGQDQSDVSDEIAPPPRGLRRYWLYHLPLLIVDYLMSGWSGHLLEGRGAWLLAQAGLIGTVTVAAYGTVLTWLLD